MNAEPDDLNVRSIRHRAVAAAKGDTNFDTILTGGRVADVITGEFRLMDVGLSGPLISSVHPSKSRDDAELIFDVSDQILSPGLIDSHLHIESSMITPMTYGQWVLPRGVTTLVWDPHEFANIWGKDGIRWALREADKAPLRILSLAPSCVPSAPGMEKTGADFDANDLQDILSWPYIHGLAEVMNMDGVINGESRMTDIVQAGLKSGKPVFGHARGLSDNNLNAYAASGISSDHEITSAQDLKSKLNAGLFIELRGSHDHLLPVLVTALSEYSHLPQTVTLCTDDVFPNDLKNSGGLDDVLRRLVSYGMPPAHVLRAATINAARRLNRHDLGVVAPGRRADIVVFNNLTDLKAEQVFFDGCLVKISESYNPVGASPNVTGPKARPFRSEDFEIHSDHKRVRLATIDNPRFTEWGETSADVVDGRVLRPEGTTLMAVANRHGGHLSQPKLAYLRGWGDWCGAFCTTVSHDSHNLTIFGADLDDITLAANTVLSQGGGLAVVKRGQAIAHLPLPVGGLVSDQPLSEVSHQFATVKSAMDQVVKWQPPYLVFKACFGASLACNPGPRLTDLGIVDMSRKAILPTPILGPA